MKRFTMEEFKPYIIKMSSGVDVRIDPDEIDGVADALNSGHFIKVRQGIVNPSFIMAIVPDEERIKDAKNIFEKVKKHNEENSRPSDWIDQYGREVHEEREPLIEFLGIPELENKFNKNTKIKRIS